MPEPQNIYILHPYLSVFITSIKLEQGTLQPEETDISLHSTSNQNMFCLFHNILLVPWISLSG